MAAALPAPGAPARPSILCAVEILSSKLKVTKIESFTSSRMKGTETCGVVEFVRADFSCSVLGHTAQGIHVPKSS